MGMGVAVRVRRRRFVSKAWFPDRPRQIPAGSRDRAARCDQRRSEEHTSELQSLMRISYAVFCLKKKKKKMTTVENKTRTKAKTYKRPHNVIQVQHEDTT